MTIELGLEPVPEPVPRFTALQSDVGDGLTFWGAFDLVAQEWAAFFKDGSLVGGITLTKEDADIAAARLEAEKNDPGVEAVIPTTNEYDY